MTRTELSTKNRTADGAKFETDMNEAVQELVAICWNNAELVRSLMGVLFRIGCIPFNYQCLHLEATQSGEARS